MIAGLLFQDAIENTLRNLWITAAMLLVFGIILWIVDDRAPQVKTIDDMTTKDAVWYGIGQMLALIPGVSRSGGTITFGRAMGYTRLGWYIIIATLPIVIAGLLFQDAIENTLRNLWITAAMLLVFGIILWIVDDRAPQVKTIDDMTTKDAVWYGIGQMLALIPGVSRSGGTITFGRAMGYTREAAVRCAFLMAIPAVFGAGILEAIKAVKEANDPTVNAIDHKRRRVVRHRPDARAHPRRVAFGRHHHLRPRHGLHA